MKKGVKKKSNFSNRLSYTIIAVLAILLVSVSVYAYTSSASTTTTSTASTAGHSINELSPPSDCNFGQALTRAQTNSGWGCTTVAAASSVPTGASDWGYERVESTIQYGNTFAVANCPSGKVVIGGGCYSASSSLSVYRSYPSSNTAWTCTVGSNSGFLLSAWAICIDN